MPRISDETRELRRTQILEAAWRCFYRQGVQATTMEEIIAEAGMSASQMYRYFANKEDIIVTAIGVSLSGLRTLLEPVFADPSLATPSAFVARVASTIETFSQRKGYNLCSIAVHGWSEAQRNAAVSERLRTQYAAYRAALVARVRAWQAACALPAEADATAIANTLFSTILGYVVQAAVMRDLPPAALAAGLAAIERAGATRDAAPRS